jgi:hypothetical protein
MSIHLAACLPLSSLESKMKARGCVTFVFTRRSALASLDYLGRWAMSSKRQLRWFWSFPLTPFISSKVLIDYLLSIYNCRANCAASDICALYNAGKYYCFLSQSNCWRTIITRLFGTIVHWAVRYQRNYMFWPLSLRDTSFGLWPRHQANDIIACTNQDTFCQVGTLDVMFFQMGHLNWNLDQTRLCASSFIANGNVYANIRIHGYGDKVSQLFLEPRNKASVGGSHWPYSYD